MIGMTKSVHANFCYQCFTHLHVVLHPLDARTNFVGTNRCDDAGLGNWFDHSLFESDPLGSIGFDILLVEVTSNHVGA